MSAAAGGDPKATLQAVDTELGRLPRSRGRGQEKSTCPPNWRGCSSRPSNWRSAPATALSWSSGCCRHWRRPGTGAAKALTSARVDAQSLNRAIEEVRKARKAEGASAEQGFDVLKKYTRDLTEAVREGKLDPVIGDGKRERLELLIRPGDARSRPEARVIRIES